MTIINSIVSWLNIKRMHQIELYGKYPFDLQQETFSRLIEKASQTEWGKKYKYKEIRSIQEFQQRVPVQSYEDVKQYVERLRKGEQNLLWPSDIRWFAKSSGTTSDKSKFIPVSREALEDCHFRAGKDIIAIYTATYPDSGLLTGKALTLGGSHRINNFSNESYYGDLSAILIENLPYWFELIRTPPGKIALLEEWEEKMEKITETTLKENVTSISGVPSWVLVLIKFILKKTGKATLPEVWPNLELFTHGGVSFQPYRKQFEELIPGQGMHYMETYNASEGFFGIQNEPGKEDMLLMLDYGIFYEFIEVERLSEANPPVLHIGEVVPGINYAMLISTNAGLWRYLIGDTIIFSSTYPHKFTISGRTRSFINVFGEELIIDNAEKAIITACGKTNALISEYTAAPVFMTRQTKGAHEWVIEFEREPADFEYFKTVFDRALMSVNSDYEAKRYKNITLDMPVIHSVKKGVFYAWFRKHNKMGGQNKIPRLSNTREFVEELLAIDETL